jgi:NAD+ diphosphatase
MKPLNVFAGAFVDRSGHRRKDPEWIRRALENPDARFAPVWRNKCLVEGDPPRAALLPHAKVDPLFAPDESVFLGMFGNHPAFAFDVESEDAPFEKDGEFHDLRYLGTVLPVEEANLVAHAIALINWHRLQRFCGLCGAPTIAESGGNTRRCTDVDCGESLFPRVDPAIIVLVSRGEHCLLGRQTSWPEGRYSTIAGFVEPGESLEDAVRREVLEETNVVVGDVHYHSSQPWPFPSSLMLGFTAEAISEDIRLNDGELEDARWFTRKEMRSGFPKLPFRLSIARRLVDGWLDED